MSTDYLKIIEKYYEKDSPLYNILIAHSEAVTEEALSIAEKVKNLNPDLKFIEEASMLHDIGIFLTCAPQIFCTGKEPYIRHGLLGRIILEKEGLPRHGLACERHMGTGLSAREIEERSLPLPKREMIPETIEEKIISFADNFFSKNKKNLKEKKSLEEARRGIKKFGEENHERFEEWASLFA